MSDAARTEPRRWPRLSEAGLVVVLLAAPGSAYGTGVLLSNMWAACDVGIAGNGFVMFFVMPALAVGLAVLGGMAYWAALRLSTAAGVRWPVLSATSVALLLCVAAVWVVIAVEHNPGGHYPATYCPPDNVHGWWPTWVPI